MLIEQALKTKEDIKTFTNSKGEHLSLKDIAKNNKKVTAISCELNGESFGFDDKSGIDFELNPTNNKEILLGLSKDNYLKIPEKLKKDLFIPIKIQKNFAKLYIPIDSIKLINWEDAPEEKYTKHIEKTN